MILLQLLFLISSVAGADSCQSFVGSYQVELPCQGLSPRHSLQIKFTPGAEQLIVTYDSPGFPPQVYTADGLLHSGDGENSGDTYTASCTRDTMNIRRLFSKLKYPLVNELKLNGNGIDYVETFEGRDGATVCRFERR